MKRYRQLPSHEIAEHWNLAGLCFKITRCASYQYSKRAPRNFFCSCQAGRRPARLVTDLDLVLSSIFCKCMIFSKIFLQYNLHAVFFQNTKPLMKINAALPMKMNVKPPMKPLTKTNVGQNIDNSAQPHMWRNTALSTRRSARQNMKKNVKPPMKNSVKPRK